MSGNNALLKIFLFLGCLAFSFFSYPVGQTKFVRNSMKEIDACEGKLKLSLVKVWGDDDAADENQFFRYPGDIKIGKDNLVYIVDSGLHRIQVFDRSGNFKKTIGQRGQGPTDLLEPCSLDFDMNNNLVIADAGNKRIQVLNPGGNYLSSFRTTGHGPYLVDVYQKNEIALFNTKVSYNSKYCVQTCSITIHDSKGNLLKEMYKTEEKAKTPDDFKVGMLYAFDNEGNIFLIPNGLPFYQEVSGNKRSLLISTFATPFKAPAIDFDESKNEPRVTGERSKIGSAKCILVDELGRVYIIAIMRPYMEKERFFLVGGAGNTRKVSKNPLPETTDMFRLLVFDKSGKIIASKRLTLFCEKIYVHGASLFIIDEWMGAKIYEYKMSFE